MISSPGIGAGLDTGSIISQLVAIERLPIDALEQRKADFNAQISAYGQLKSALSSFQSSMSDLKSADKFEVYSTSSSDETSITASANTFASKGTYTIDITNLAVAEKQGSAAFADTDTTLIGNAGDTMTITVNGKTLAVDYGGKTLDDIRTAINAAAALSTDVDVTASIVSESASSNRLVLTSGNSGTDYTMGFSFQDSGGGAIADPFTLGTIVTAENAAFTIDGTYALTRNSNTVTDAIKGVTLNLEKETTGLVVSVDRDLDAVKSNIQGFVTAYNSLSSTLKSLRDGDLDGDSTVRSVQSQLQSTLNTAPTGLTTIYEYLAQIGVELDRDGVMSVDSTSLTDALNTDFSGVSELFSNNAQGYAYRLDALVDDLLDVEGFLKSREDGLQARIDTLDSRIGRMEFRLDVYEDRLRQQYTNLDVLMGSMQQTSQFLSGSLGIYI